MRRLSRLLLVVWLCALSGAALAEKRVALILSVDDYATLRPLKNPGNDADLIEDALDKLGFDVTTQSNRDLRRMRRALEDFTDDATGADVALIYFAGHGVEIAGENRLLPADADASSLSRLKDTSVTVDELRAAGARVAKSLLIVLDACRNDPFGAGASLAGRGAAPLNNDVKQSVKPGLGRIGRAENTLFAFSAAPGETAADGSGDNSPFASALARYIGTDGLEIRSVLTLVQQEVYDETEGRQLPYVESGLPQMFFAAQTGPLPEREALLLAMADVTPQLREEVERVAAANAMPLAPLYGALISADLKTLSPPARDAKLAEAAQAFAATRDELRKLASTDPEVSRLRGEAEKNLALGAFEKARGNLAEAARIDGQSADALAGKLVARRVSEADSNRATAGVALAQLDYAGAIAAYEQAASLHLKIENEDVPDAARSKRNWVLGELGDLHARIGSSSKALDAYQRMEQSARLRLAKSPDNDDAIRDLGLSLVRVGDMRATQGEPAAAMAAYQEALELRGAQRDRMWARSDADWLAGIADIAERIGGIHRQNRDTANALKFYGNALQFRRWLAENHGAQYRNRSGLAANLGSTGQLHYDAGDIDAAAKAWSEQLGVARKLVADFPDLTDAKTWLFRALMGNGDIDRARGRNGQAADAFGEIVALATALLAKDPNLANVQFALAQAHAALGGVHDLLSTPTWNRDSAAALREYGSALAAMDKLTALDERNADWKLYRARVMTRIGRVYFGDRKYNEGAPWYEKSIAILRTLVDSPAVGRDSLLALMDTASMAGVSRNFAGDEAAAERFFAEAVSAGDRLDLANSPDMALRGIYETGLYNLGLLQRRFGKRSEARATYMKKLAMQEDNLVRDAKPWRQRAIVATLIDVARLSDDPKPHFEAALALAETLQSQGELAADDPQPSQIRDWLSAEK